MICSPHSIFFPVGKLPFNCIRVESGLVADGGKKSPEAVHGGLGMIADSVQGKEHGVFRKGFFGVMNARKDISPVTMKNPYPVENGMYPVR